MNLNRFQIMNLQTSSVNYEIGYFYKYLLDMEKQTSNLDLEAKNMSETTQWNCLMSFFNFLFAIFIWSVNSKFWSVNYEIAFIA